MNHWLESLARDTGVVESRRFIVPWDVIEEEIGSPLPSDYKEFIGHFGPGDFNDFFRVNAPGTGNRSFEFRVYARRFAEELRSGGRDTRSEPHFSAFPEPGGLLTWGGTVDGDPVHWVTEGAPDDWYVLAEDRPGWNRQVFAGSMSEFVYRYLSGDLEVTVFSESECGPPIEFEPWDAGWLGLGEPLEQISYFEEG